MAAKGSKKDAGAKTSAPSAKPGPANLSDGAEPDYGLDSPHVVRSMYSRAAWTFAFGFALWFMNRVEYPGPAAKMFLALALIAAAYVWAGWYMTWSSRRGKLQLREKLVALLALNGEEKVLDGGCGLGFLSTSIAKRLKTGKVTAVDVWNPQVLSANSAEAALANARREGVADRIRFEDGDIRKFGFPAANFDVAVSALAVHFFDDEPDRDQIVRELYRVVKPGGKLMIFDTSNVSRYADVLRECGASDVTLTSTGFLWCRLTKAVTARK